MPSNFLALPRDLRDFIYELTLVDQDDIDLGTWIYPRPLSPQLLRTNKMIHHEATSLLHTYNRLKLVDTRFRAILSLQEIIVEVT